MDDADALKCLLAKWFDAFGRYRREDGATSDLDLTVYLLYLSIQNALSIGGDIAELGVLRGGPFALLSTMIKDQERAHAIDVFDLYLDHPDPAQRFGNDPGGFQDTVRRIDGVDASYNLIRADTRKPEQAAAVIASAGRNCRFFHIDGGHHLVNIRADLRIAAACTSENPHPVIAVDDTFASVMPEVTEGLLEFLRSNDQYAVFLLASNKTYLCRKPDLDFYAMCAIQFLTKGLRSLSDRVEVRYLNGEPCVALRTDAAPEAVGFSLGSLRELVARDRKLPRIPDENR